MPARTMTSQTAFTGVWVLGLIRFHQREPGRALSRAKANTTRDASTPWAAPVTNWKPTHTQLIHCPISLISSVPYLDHND